MNKKVLLTIFVIPLILSACNVNINNSDDSSLLSSSNEESSLSEDSSIFSSEIVIRENLLNKVDKPVNVYKVLDDKYVNSLYQFSSDLLENLFDQKSNTVFSPLSISLAMNMLYEGTANNSREELKKLMHYDDSLDVAEASKNTIQSTNREIIEDDKLTSYLSVSESAFVTPYFAPCLKEEYLNALSYSYYAEMYQTMFGTHEADELIANWINDNTNNFFNLTPEDIASDPGVVMMLINTLYMKTTWATRPDEIIKMKFNNIDKTTKETDFLHFDFNDFTLYKGNDYIIGSIELNGNFYYNFLLPNEGKDDVINNKENYEALYDVSYRKKNLEENLYKAQIYLPKYKDLSSFDLLEKFINMGVRDIFSSARADFTNMIDGGGLFVSLIQHDAGVDVNEEGIEGAAYTVIAMEKSMMPQAKEKIDLYIDRPFLYSITYRDLPLFVGAKTSF